MPPERWLLRRRRRHGSAGPPPLKGGIFSLRTFRSAAYFSKIRMALMVPVLFRERRAVSRWRPRSRLCSAARRRGELQIRWSTTACSAWTSHPCRCRRFLWLLRWQLGHTPLRARRRRHPCRHAAVPGALVPGSRSSRRRCASRVLTASTAAAAAVAMA